MTIHAKTLAAGLAVAALITTAACGGAETAPTSRSAGEDSQPSETTNRQDIDIAVVRGTAEYDYEAVTSVTELAEQEPSVTVGKVAGWTDGRSQVESEGGYEDTSLFAVLRIDVDKSYRAPEGQDADSPIYVEVPRGGEVRVDGKRPTDTEPVRSTIEELNSAVPKGTRVIVVGRAAPTAAELRSQTPGSTVRNAEAGRPAGADLLSPHVQGLIFEDEQGNFVSGLAGDEKEWGWVPSDRRAGDGFSYLVDQLKTLDG